MTDFPPQPVYRPIYSLADVQGRLMSPTGDPGFFTYIRAEAEQVARSYAQSFPGVRVVEVLVVVMDAAELIEQDGRES